MFDEENEKPGLRLRKKHQELADELGMTPWEYLEYMHKIKTIEEKRQLAESPMIRPEQTASIELIDNIEGLGYSKQFMSKDDAEFFYEEFCRYEEQHSYVEANTDEDPTITKRDLMIATYMATGVKYDFKKVGLTLYSIFGFLQSNYSNFPTQMYYIPEQFLYNHRTKEFRYLRDEEGTDIAFLDE